MIQFNTNIGECIYCGDVDSPLTREHVLPRGLGGNLAPNGYKNALVLQNASCERCRRITESIEHECLNSMLGPARARLGLKRKDRSTGKVDIIVELIDGSTEHRDIHESEVHGAMVIPAYYEAGALTNRPISNTAPCDYKFIVVAPASKQILDETRRVGVQGRANPKTFAQMLAKIALGATVAQFGVKGFKPLVRNLILKNPNEYGHWIGGFAGMESKELPTKEFHQIDIFPAKTKAGIFIIAEIRLFAEFGGPRNYVLVGRPS